MYIISFGLTFKKLGARLSLKVGWLNSEKYGTKSYFVTNHWINLLSIAQFLNTFSTSANETELTITVAWLLLSALLMA